MPATGGDEHDKDADTYQNENTDDNNIIDDDNVIMLLVM